MAGHRGQVVAILVWSLLCGPAGVTALAASQTSTQSSSSAAKKKSSRKHATHKKTSHASPRLRRMRQAFVASATLRPMARQLLQDRTPAAYAGVQAFAVRHAKEDAGALAWLVIGYARILDHDYSKAIDPLSRAKPQAGDLGDYVNFYLASAYQQTGRTAEAIATFSAFEKTYHESLLIRDAHVAYANALVADGRAKEAAALLEADRQPIRADLELALGRAYEAGQQPAKALTIFRNLFYTMPTSTEAGQVQGDLTRLGALTQAPPVGLEAHRTRADLLMKGKQFGDAAGEYRILMGEVNATDRPGSEILLAEALRRAGQAREAKKILELIPTSPPELNAQRIFNLGELARSVNDDDSFLRGVDQLRQLAPTSTWLEQALFSAGNIYLLRRDYDHAIDSFRELQERFPNGARSSYAHWKAAWLNLRQGREAEAKTGFDNQIALYPSSSEVPAALYWRARLAEEDKEWSLARAFYLKLSQRYR
ncbi:MAG: tetratricopeptide repeat protein, partial [Terriglobales bacterium]